MAERKTTSRTKRKDSDGRVLKKGERQIGRGKGYEYRYTDHFGKRQSIYVSTLDELREKIEDSKHQKELVITNDARKMTMNNLYALWKSVKRGLKESTFHNYQYMYEKFAMNEIGNAGNQMPPLITDAEVGEYLRRGADVAKWLKDLQDYALRSCLDGKEIPGFKAVEGRGSRDWTDQDEAFKALQGSGVPEAMLYERKPLTLAAIEKVVGKKAFAEAVGQFVQKNPGKPTLVPETDKRPAITSVDTAFREAPTK